MFSPFPLLRTAWEFYRKQPVLNQVMLWLLFLPLLGLQVAGHLLGPPAENPWPALNPGPGLSLLLWLAGLLLGVTVTWGYASVLLIGKRLIKSPAGRSRTSFKAVRSQSLQFVMPLILTNLLHALCMLLGLVLLVIPGVVFAVRTGFYPVALVAEKKLYLSALRRSNAVVRGRTLQIFASMLLLGLVTFLPAGLVTGLAATIMGAVDGRLLAIADAVEAAAFSFAVTLHALATIEMYAHLREADGSDDEA